MIESDEAIYQPAPQPYDSLLRPWRELVRPGDIPGRRSAILGGLTGAILRFALVFFLIVSVLVLIQMLGQDTTYEAYVFEGASRRAQRTLETSWVVLAVWHCAAGLTVVFLKVKFWQLQLLATLINVPVVMFLAGTQHVLGPMQYGIFGYLDLWLIFLLARWPPTYKLLDFLNDEIHYYLID
jgi:hypothetical protein